MGLFENATQFSHALHCVCLTAGDKKRGTNANLTEFYSLTISGHKWILLLITHQRRADISWIILWGTCSAPRQASFFFVQHITCLESACSRYVCSMSERCSRERPTHPKLRSNWKNDTVASHSTSQHENQIHKTKTQLSICYKTTVAYILLSKQK